jgi:hypothetical protein
MPNIILRLRDGIAWKKSLSEQLSKAASSILNCSADDIVVIHLTYSATDINAGLIDIELEALAGENNTRLALTTQLSSKLTDIANKYAKKSGLQGRVSTWVKIYLGGAYSENIIR